MCPQCQGLGCIEVGGMGPCGEFADFQEITCPTCDGRREEFPKPPVSTSNESSMLAAIEALKNAMGVSKKSHSGKPGKAR